MNLRDRLGRRLTASRRPALRLRLESLEDRTVPSTFTVLNLNDGGPDSLRAAIAAANASPDADLIQFAGGLHGTIPLTSELSITQDLTIDGPGAGSITVSGNQAGRVFRVTGAGTDVAIKDLTIADGVVSAPAGIAVGGGLLNDGANVSLTRVVFADNRAVGVGAGGGAVACLGGHLMADHTDFRSNSASASRTNFANGGAIYDDLGAVVDIEHGTFAANRTDGGNANGGAIGHYGASRMTVGYCSFAGNEVLALPPGEPSLGLNAAGGAIQAVSGQFSLFPEGGPGFPTLTIAHCSFTGNLAHAAPTTGDLGGTADGGALDVEVGPVATVSDCIFAGNQSRGSDGLAGGDGGAGGSGGGGAIRNAGADLTVRNSLFLGNEAHGGNGGQAGSGGSGGAGGWAVGGAVETLSLTFLSLTATTTIADCRFVDNRGVAGGGGAGGSGGDGGPGGLAWGGGIFNVFGTLTVSGSLFVGNQATGGAGGAAGLGGIGGDGGLASGGGVVNSLFGLGGTATISGTAVVDNQAIGGAGGAGGGHGGDGRGGGLFNGGGGVMTVDDSRVLANRAEGGAAGTGGSAGTGTGGGIFNNGLIALDALTVVRGNQADTFDDCFGCP